MRAEKLAETIRTLLPIQRTVCVEGIPGGGKTSIVQQVAEQERVGYIELHMPTMLVEDFGILYPNGDDKLNYKLPYWWPSADRTDIPDVGILCFDDRNQASADLQKVLANICQARTLHGSKLKDGWMVVSTGNRVSDRAGANRILSHLRNRETVIELETQLDDWTRWAMIPDNNVNQDLVSFLRFRPNLLHDFDPQRESNPSPRSWVEGVSNIMGIVPEDLEYECFKGAIGEGAASEFVGFLKIYRELPDPDKVLREPDSVDVPSDPTVKYALSGALAERVDTKTFANMLKFFDRFDGAEFGVLAVSYALRKTPELSSTEAFTKWAVDKSDMLF